MLTGVVLARNEEANIVDCLQALRPHVEESILIDMESSDRTVELARPLVHKVLRHPLVPEFDAARNMAIAEARHEWLWFVDADERISPRTGEVVRQLIQAHGSQFEAIVIPFKSYFCGQWMRHCGWWPGYTMPRVLKRGTFRFVPRVHGGVEVSGRQVRLPPDPEIGIDHYSYRSVEHYLEKLNRYTSSEAQQLAERGLLWDWREALREMVRDLWMYYEYNPGQLDRERGWILSWLSGQYRWLARAKLIDLPPKDPDAPPPFGGTAPESLDEVLELWQQELSRLRASQPRLPLGIVWRSPLFDPSGYADEARAFVKGLASGERGLRIEEFRWSDRTCALEPGDCLLLKTLTRSVRPGHAATITDCIPTLVDPDPNAALNILRTTFETDRLPEGWLPRLARFDEVWVPSQQNYRAFRRRGMPPERLRVVPSCYDQDLYRPEGPRLQLPPELRGRFVFLSVFDWQLRKGWDLLLRGYCQEFSAGEPVGLLLKITRAHGHTLPLVRAQADEVLAEFGQSLVHRPDIVLWDMSLGAREMAALYRSASAFVLPSRGEGWGRPYLEAMACGLPTIGTRHLGSDEFLADDNSFLVDASLVTIPEAAAREIPPYRGHQWYEPDLMGLRRAMRRVFSDEVGRNSVAARAAQTVKDRFGLAAGRQAIESALLDAERRFTSVSLPTASASQARVVLEGELFALHSFSNINEQLALQLAQDPRLALSLSRVQNQPVYDEVVPHAWQLRPYLGRSLEDGPQVTIRHAFPPNWQPVPQGLWVHIQPWEFGHLPTDWIEPLRDHVDEAWVPSNYVKRVFERSGVPADKVRVIPWGIEPDVFSPDAEPLLLPTEKSFRFLFVGGLIGRKGFDTLLTAYLAEFGPDEHVCLVVKDLGSQTFYRFGNFRNELLAAKTDPSKPAIVYLEDSLTAGQLASLYTACQCLTAPYRAEGFGLPILEAMACGLAPAVTAGGAADDFTSPETAYLIPGREVETLHDWPLCGPPLELSVSVSDVRRALRLAFEDRERTRRLGQSAARAVRQEFTWQRTAGAMADRLVALVHARQSTSSTNEGGPTPAPVAQSNGRPLLGACLASHGGERHLPFALAQVTPFVDETVVVVAGPPDRSEAIAREYGAKVVALPDDGDASALCSAAMVASQSEWVVWVDLQDRLSEDETEQWRTWATDQPRHVAELVLDLPKSRLADSPFRPDRHLRLMRHAANGIPVERAQPVA
jgi:glycosyltransferase involved in cell wall biosynthesis